MTPSAPKQFFLIVPLAVLIFLMQPVRMSAQAAAAARKGSEIAAFGMYSYVNPDFGGHNNTAGAIFGVDYTRTLGWWINPGAEFRVNLSPGTPISEHVYSGGLRAEGRIKRYSWLHPYADILIGYGTMNFTNPNFNPIGGKPSNSSTVWTYGGGLDVDLYRQWSVRADYQGSHWSIGQGLTLAPTSFGAGVVYNFHF